MSDRLQVRCGVSDPYFRIAIRDIGCFGFHRAYLEYSSFMRCFAFVRRVLRWKQLCACRIYASYQKPERALTLKLHQQSHQNVQIKRNSIYILILIEVSTLKMESNVYTSRLSPNIHTCVRTPWASLCTNIPGQIGWDCFVLAWFNQTCATKRVCVLVCCGMDESGNIIVCLFSVSAWQKQKWTLYREGCSTWTDGRLSIKSVSWLRIFLGRPLWRTQPQRYSNDIFKFNDVLWNKFCPFSPAEILGNSLQDLSVWKTSTGFYLRF